MWKRAALLFVFVLFLGTPVVALTASGPLNKLVKIPLASPAAVSRYIVDGLALGGQVKPWSQPYLRYQCNPSDQFPGFISCNEEHTIPGKEVTRYHSILESQDGTAYYVNSYFQPAFFDPNDVQNEISRMSSEFGQQARIIQMPQREGFPNAVIAIWGAIQLEPLNPDEISEVASGGSHPGILVSFLGDPERSAKAGVPVYRLAGGAGFLWAATFDQNGKGMLRYLAIDDSKIEPSHQVATNQPAPVPTPSFEAGNQTTSSQSPTNSPVVAQQSSQQQLRSQTEDAQAQAKESQYRSDLEEEKQRIEEADRQRKELQQRATIIEVAIAAFVLLCVVAVATLLRMKRQTSPQQIQSVSGEGSQPKVCEEDQISSENNQTKPIETNVSAEPRYC